ncbi:general substrate transporter [Lasiosphaeria miniovina]|uniref:General substrate transporter n=1 Tax=Lasiosphaeria miniovina TaxID=1954250 RepID=A0AA40A4X0_9PEZI|nr:general substrate transporter [Lasiosphaeria miniovina]KAK0709201.1 general substrate transporter [Lasiosphaeria miniovina]
MPAWQTSWGMGVSKATWRLHCFCLFLALGSFVWGYNVGVLASVLVHPGFKETLDNPDASKSGLITAIYYLGTWTSYIFFAHPAADRLGRRYAALTGMFVTCLGQALQVGASGPSALAMIIAGRIIAGMGTGIISTSVPLYQSEIAPAKHRGKYVVMNHIGFVAGLAMGFWVGYAVTFWDTPNGHEMGWRLSLAISFIPGFFFVLGLPFMHESPRWLVEHGQSAAASKTLQFYREGYYSADEVEAELAEIENSVAAFKASGLTWISLFTDPSLFARLWRSTLLQFMAQMCGATAMKYYLPVLFKALGLGSRLSLLAGGIESTLKIGCTVLEMVIIDKFGRRLTLVVGAAVMAFALLINGALPLVYPNNVNRASDYTCIVFVFIYSLGYSMGFGPAAWVYGSEIFPTAARARGLSFAASAGAIGSIVVAQIWPIGIATIGSKIYFFFMAINLICVPIIYLLYPETNGRRLEDMDVLFGGNPAVYPTHLLDQDVDDTRGLVPKNISGQSRGSGA